MKKVIVLILGLFVFTISSHAYRAAATFIAEQGNTIQVIIDGKVMNEQPKEMVNIVGRPGEHEISFTFFDENGLPSYGDVDCIQLLPGYKSFYSIVEDNDCGELIKLKLEPYSKLIFKNPDIYYSQKYYAYLDVNRYAYIHAGEINYA